MADTKAEAEAQAVWIAAQLNNQHLVTIQAPEDEPLNFTGGTLPVFYNVSFDVKTGTWTAGEAFDTNDEFKVL